MNGILDENNENTELYLITIQEASLYLHIPLNTLYKNYERLPYVRITNRIMFDKRTITEFIRKQMQKGL